MGSVGGGRRKEWKKDGESVREMEGERERERTRGLHGLGSPAHRYWFFPPDSRPLRSTFDPLLSSLSHFPASCSVLLDPADSAFRLSPLFLLALASGNILALSSSFHMHSSPPYPFFPTSSPPSSCMCTSLSHALILPSRSHFRLAHPFSHVR